MRGRRLGLIVLALLLGIQAALGPLVPFSPPAPVRAAEDCSVSIGGSGGVLSVCPGADGYADLSEHVSTAYDDLRAARQTATLTITATPDGARVSVDGIEVGSAPTEVSVTPGVHHVRAESDGYAPASTTVTTGGSQPATVALKLERSGAGLGSYQWLHAATLMALADVDPSSALGATRFVLDRDGVAYVAFQASTIVEVNFERPQQPPNYSLDVLTEWRPTVRTVGVIRSSDGGQSWSLVQRWQGAVSGRAWTSNEFVDSEWDPSSCDLPESFDHHAMRVWYNETHEEDWWISNLVPRPEGGVSIFINHYRSDKPQEVMRLWDYYGRQDFPGKCFGDEPMTIKLGPDGEYSSIPSDDATSRWGIGFEDLVSYNPIIESTDHVIGSGGGDTVMAEPAGDYMWPIYQASRDGVDYYLAYDATDRGRLGMGEGTGYILTSGDSGVTLEISRSYTLDRLPGADRRTEDLRIGPDGSLYILDHLSGRVFLLEDGGPRLLGTVPSEIHGVYGGNNVPMLSAEIDSGGNVHAAVRASAAPNQNRELVVSYQYFPRDPVEYRQVVLLTEPDCPACDAARDFLTDAGIAFSEDPADVPAELATSAGSEASANGYPVLVRIGSESVAAGGAIPVKISRVLGVSSLIGVATYEPEIVPTQAPPSSPLQTLQPQWLATFVEDGAPAIVVPRGDAVVVYRPTADGGWEAAPFLTAPGSVGADWINTASGTSIYAPAIWWPLFPGSVTGEGQSFTTRHDVAFGKAETLADFVYLYASETIIVDDGRGDTHSQVGYTLWSTETEPESSAYRAVSHASQLIPAATFFVWLGEKGNPSALTGELAGYVTDQGVVTEDGDRVYRVTVDLRARNETAQDGNIVGRTIGGALHVETETPDGTPESRNVSLYLIVDNTRLRSWDPGGPSIGRDITAEAVHFAGDEERWVVTNNIALSNSVPCGPDQAIVLDPFSVATFSAETAASYELTSCLAALEAEPVVITECPSWEAAQATLAAETINSFAASLPLLNLGGITNYEMAFGSRSATVHRIVALDTGGGDGCPATAGATAGVIRISGTILGADEAYRPTIQLLESGTTLVSTASTTRPGELTHEREWLEMEAAFLQTTLSIPKWNEPAARILIPWYFERAAERDLFTRQLIAVRALLHCNYEGQGLATVRLLINRLATIPEGLAGTIVCLRDFDLQPGKHWPTYDPRLFAGREPGVGTLITQIDNGLSGNITLRYLVAVAGGQPVTFANMVIGEEKRLKDGIASSGYQQDPANNLIDQAYARLQTMTARELGNAQGGMLLGVLLASELDRLAIRWVAECAKTFGAENPYQAMWELTRAVSYTAGIRCVDGKSTSAQKIDAYRLLGLGLRSPLFRSIVDAAGSDLDLLDQLLASYGAAVERLQEAESRYPAATRISTYDSTLPTLDRMVIIQRQVEANAAARGHRLTVTEAAKLLAGMVDCGISVAIGLGAGVVLALMGQLAMAVGSGAAIASHVLFIATGVVITKMTADDLAQAWESLNLRERAAGLCSVVISAVTTLAPAGATSNALARSGQPPRVINIERLPRLSKALAADLVELFGSLRRRGGKVLEEEAPLPPRSRPFQALLDSLPEARRAQIAALGEQLIYEKMDAPHRAVFDDLSQEFGKPDGVTAVMTRITELLETSSSGPDRAITARVGGAFAADLVAGRPKSLRVAGGPNGLVGSEAGIVQAVIGDGRILDELFSGPITISEIGQAAPDLPGRFVAVSEIEAFLGSDRMAVALSRSGPARALFTPQEITWLAEVQRLTRPKLGPEMLRELAGTRLVEAVRTGLEAARRDAGLSDSVPIDRVTIDYIGSGTDKSTFRLQLHPEGSAQPISAAVKFGTITPEDAQVQAALAAPRVGRAAEALIPEAISGIGGSYAFTLEKWIDTPSVSDVTARPGISEAVARFDVDILVESGSPDFPAAARGKFPDDVKLDNLKLVSESAGQPEVITIDFDAQHMVLTPESPADYLAMNVLTRVARPGFKVNDIGAYVRETLASLSRKPGWSEASARDAMAGARDLLRASDPPRGLGGLQSAMQFLSGVDPAPGSAAAAAALDALLASP